MQNDKYNIGIDTEEASDSWEYKLRKLKGEIEKKKEKDKNKKAVFKDKYIEEDDGGEGFGEFSNVTEYAVTAKDEDNYLENKKRRKILRDKDYLLGYLHSKYSITKKIETFSELLLRLIKEKDLKPSECYKRANIDRRVFFKIKNEKYYMPRKDTVLAFAISLKLDYFETENLLKSAGYAFCDSRITDVIVSHYIEKSIYYIDKINHTLDLFGQAVLGTKCI